MGTNGRRFLAYIIDSVIAIIPMYIFARYAIRLVLLGHIHLIEDDVLHLKVILTFTEGFGEKFYTLSLLIATMSLMTYIVLNVFVPYFCNGQTIGKIITKCRVISITNKRLTLDQLLLRKIFNVLTMSFGILVIYISRDNLVDFFKNDILIFEYSKVLAQVNYGSKGFSIISVLVTIIIGLSVILNRKYSIGIHDRIARTRVISSREDEKLYFAKAE